MTEVVEQEVQAVVFYGWLGTDEKGRAYPTSQIIRISGGESRKTDDGGRVRVPVKEARFHNGRFETSDPEIIKELRRKAKLQGSGITESPEVFYSMTMSAEQQLKRQAVIGNEKAAQVESLTEENNRLRRMLEEKGKSEPAPRSRSAA